MCELGSRLQRLYEYRQMRERWAQMAFLEAKSSRMSHEEAGEVSPQLEDAEAKAYEDWKRARLDFESIHLIWDAAQRLEAPASESESESAAA